MNNVVDKILNVDKVPKELTIVLAVVSLIGGYLVTNEILEEYPNFFCQNMTKKIILWSVLYLQTKSLYSASLVSTVIVLLFPKIFFGKLTGTKVN